MELFFKELISNLTIIGLGIVIFVFCYASNMFFSAWKNVKISLEKFDWHRVLDGVIKCGVFCAGMALMCVGITSIPIYCNAIGFTIADEFIEYFKILTVAGIFITSSCRYIVEAFGKAKEIIGGVK